MSNMAKSLKKPAERTRKQSRLNQAHMKQLTHYVSSLRKANPDKYFPNFDPDDGGITAEILFLLEKPGPKTVESGFISRDNNDQSAQNTFNFMQRAKIPREKTIIWNVIPGWDGERKVKAANLNDGVEELENLLQFLPNLKSVVLVGRQAQKVKARLKSKNLRVYCSPHPSPLVQARYPDKFESILEIWASAFKDLSGFYSNEIISSDNFGPEDSNWTGTKGKIDLDKFFANNGAAPVSVLELLIASLIKGYRPDLSDADSRKKLLQFKLFLENKRNLGNNLKPDEAMLAELGKRVHAERLFENPEKEKLEVQPLAEGIITEFQELNIIDKEQSLKSSARRLVRRFNKDPDKYLILGTLDKYEVDEYLKKIGRALTLLNELGLSADLESLSSYHPAKLGNRRNKMRIQGDKGDN